MHIIKPLLREGRVDFTGRFYQAPDCELIPRGPRPAGPPLLLAGNRPRMVDIVAQHADMWNTAWHAEPTGARERLELMRQACERNGRDPATLELTAGVAIAYTDLGGKSNFAVSLSDGVAEALHGYAEMGIKHVIFDVKPFTPEALDAMVAVLRWRWHGVSGGMRSSASPPVTPARPRRRRDDVATCCAASLSRERVTRHRSCPHRDASVAASDLEKETSQGCSDGLTVPHFDGCASNRA